MQLWTNPLSFEDTLELLENRNVDALLVGKDKFNICNNFDLDNMQLNQIISKNKQNKKIIISINKIFHENEIDELKEYLLTLKNKKIRGILFQDFGVKQICDEINLKTTFIYAGNSLVVNYGQFPFYYENGIKVVCLSNELFLNEIKQLQNHKHGMHLLMQVEGYTMLMQSKWKLLSIYQDKKKIMKKLNFKPFLLKEESCLENINDLLNIDYFFINSFMHNKQWVNITLDIYHQLITKKKNLTQLIKSRNKLNTSVSTNGFLNAPKSLLHLRKENEK